MASLVATDRSKAHLGNPPPAPSTAGDSDSTAPPLQASEQGIDVNVLRDLAKTGLIESLNAIQGAKTLILDSALAGPLGLVTDVALLKHQAVDKMFWLEPGPLNVNTKNVVWLCRPKRGFMRIIADQIRAQQAAPSSSTGPVTFTILFVPRATELCRKTLESEGVAGDVNVAEFKLEFIPLEDDVLSLEMENVARDIYLNGDDTSLYYSSLALMTFQRAYGLFPRILGKGDAAERLAHLLIKHRHSGLPQFSELEASDQLDSLIIVDRSTDWITPMCTQLTYEGMIDEYIGIRNTHVEVDPSLLSTAPPAPSPAGTPGLTSTPLTKKKKHPLSARSDRLFSQLRDLNFATVGSKLSKVAKRLEGDYGGVKDLKSVSQMKEFVGKLGGLQNEHQGLRLHTGLTELLMPITRTEEFNKSLEVQQNLIAGYDTLGQLATIEELMSQQASMMTVLRAVVLLSLTSGGIKQKALDAFKREFLQVYGYHHLPLLIALEELSLLTKPPSRHVFAPLRKSLRLVVDDVNDVAPNDISFVYSGYAPLSIRLVQCVSQKPAVLSAAVDDSSAANGKRVIPQAHPIVGWKGFEEVLATIPGKTVDEVQKLEGIEMQERRPAKDSVSTTVVFFVGGCTYTEISALRWMSKQAKGRRYMIATTNVINGSSLLEGMGNPAPVQLNNSS